MKKFILLIFLLFLNCSVFANVFEHPQTLSNITGQLPELNSITCKFRQEKTVSTAKLKSSGTFKFVKNEGVTFYTTYPTTFTTTYNSSEYKQINDIINAISNKSYSKIEKAFNFYFDKTQDNWQLGLKPKSNHPSAKYLKSIEIYGKSYINQMIITTVNSTKTTIWFEK